jgi:hypothetical protein
MSGLQTSGDLLAKLSAAARKSLSESEIREQRISFILSAVDDNSSITKAQIERVINHLEGQPN